MFLTRTKIHIIYSVLFLMQLMCLYSSPVSIVYWCNLIFVAILWNVAAGFAAAREAYQEATSMVMALYGSSLTETVAACLYHGLECRAADMDDSVVGVLLASSVLDYMKLEEVHKYVNFLEQCSHAVKTATK